jgi:UDP-GlcNAc:undecaprenyl-phosphate GlcNAc-1-phosphate transferase
MENLLLFLTIISFLVTFSTTPFVARFARKFNLVDNPKERPHPAHTHKGIIPRAGGVGIFLGIFLPIILLSMLNKNILFIFGGALILVSVGIWDDRKNRSPYIRFITCSIAALIAIMGGVGIPYITNPLDGIIRLDSIPIVANLFAFFWIVWTTNIIGWSGGVDGQLPGFVSISALIIGLLSLRYAGDINQQTTTYLSFTTFGAFLGFIPWNFYPQKIMPGYGGKTLAGFMLATLSILSYSKLGTALLVLIVPMADAFFIFFKRILSGHSPVWATSGHFHHYLLALGWSKRRIAIFYWCISAVAGIIALNLNSKQKIFAVILILVLVSGVILGLNFLKKLPDKTEDNDY